MTPPEDPACETFVRTVLDLYRRAPGTTGRIRPADRRLARDLYGRGVCVRTVHDALLLASARRFARPMTSHPPATARSLAYFLPVVDELLAAPIDDSYRRHLTRALERALSRPPS